MDGGPVDRIYAPLDKPWCCTRTASDASDAGGFDGDVDVSCMTGGGVICACVAFGDVVDTPCSTSESPGIDVVCCFAVPLSDLYEDKEESLLLGTGCFVRSSGGISGP